jgi:hypothetical protein
MNQRTSQRVNENESKNTLENIPIFQKNIANFPKNIPYHKPNQTSSTPFNHHKYHRGTTN